VEEESRNLKSDPSPEQTADSASPLHLLFTTFIVGVLGFATWLSITNPFEEARIESKIAGQASPSLRAPASLAGKSAGTQRKQNALEVFCGRMGQRIETSEPQVRLKLVNCKAEKSEVEVLNSANGFTASVFQENSLLTTDYIDLVAGENALRIKSVDVKSALPQTDVQVVFILTQNK
jgi:hypothetical protein